jgi:ABC-type glycerol-3-phosphate transport system substrate-binding protein
MKMRNAFLVLGTAVIMLSGCSGSSSSGSTLDMNGTWMIYPTSTSTSIAFESFRATLQQSGASVNSTIASGPCAGAGTLTGTATMAKV